VGIDVMVDASLLALELSLLPCLSRVDGTVCSAQRAVYWQLPLAQAQSAVSLACAAELEHVLLIARIVSRHSMHHAYASHLIL